MATQYAIETVYRLQDSATPALTRIQSATGVTRLAIDRLAKSGAANWDKFKGAVATAGSAIIGLGASAINGAKSAAVEAVQKYVDFENVLTAAGSKFADLDVTSSDYQDNLDKLSKAAQEVGAVTKFSASDAMGALDKMAMAGISSAGAMNMLMGTTNLASAAGIDLTSAVDMATDAMGAFNLSTEASVVAENMNRVSDVVAKATNMANFDMGMWFETVKMGAPAFTSLGGEIEEFTAIAGTLANAGLKGSQAGNEIKNMMLNLSAPASSGAKALSSLGISVFDSQGKMRSFTDILGQFETKLDGMADAQKSDLLKDIFGKEQIGAFNVLLASGTQNLSDFTDKLKEAHELGLAETIATAQSKSLQGQISALQSAIEAKQLQFGEAVAKSGGLRSIEIIISRIQNIDFGPVVAVAGAAFDKISQIVFTVIDGIAMKMGDFNATSIVESFNNIDVIAVASPIISLVTTIGDVISQLWEMKEVLFVVFAAMKLWQGFTMIVFGITNAMKVYKAVTDAVKIAQAALNVVMAANPIGLIVIAIAALIGIFVLLWNKCDAFRNFWISLWEGIKSVTATVIGAIGDFFSWIGGKIGEFISFAGDKIMSFVSWIGEKFSAIGSFFTEFFSFIGGKITEFFSWVWEKITGFFSWIGEKLSSFGTSIGGFFTGLLNIYSEFILNISNKIVEFFSWIWEKVSGFFLMIGTAISEFAVSTWEKITGFFSMVVDGFTEFASSVWETITTGFSAIPDFFVNIGSGIINAFWSAVESVKGFFSGLVGTLKSVGMSVLSFVLAPIEKVLGLAKHLPGVGSWAAEAEAKIRQMRAELTVQNEATPMVAPTNAQSTMATNSTTESNAYMTIGLEKGLTGTVSGEAPNITVQQHHSGSF